MIDQRRLRTIGLTLAVGGAVLVVAGRLGVHPAHAAPAALTRKREGILLVGLASLLAATVVLPLEQGDRLLQRQRLPHWLAPAVLAGVGLLLIWALLVALNQSLWHDEAYSALRYTSRGPGEILFGDYVPNDHVLFNMLAWLTTGVLGESEVAYRLWSVLPALAGAAALLWWSWNRLGRVVTVAVAVLVATSPMILLLARDARGYGLAFLAGALALLFADRLSRRQTVENLVGFGVAGLIGTATLPVFAVAFVGQALPLMAKRAARARVAATVAGVGVLTLILYAPLLSDVLDATGQQFGRQLPWHGPLSGAMTDLLGPSIQIVFAPDLPPELPNQAVRADNAIAGCLALAGAVLLWRAGERMLDALLVVPVLFVYTVFTVANLFVEPRFAAFLLFHTIVLAAAGVVGLIAILPASWARALATGAAVVAAAFATVHAVRVADAVHDVPRENFKDAAAVVRMDGRTPVLTDSTRPQGLQYYLGAENVVQLPNDALEERFCSEPALTYVEHPYRGAGETPPPDLSCLRNRGAKVVRVRQRDRGGHIDVWTLATR